MMIQSLFTNIVKMQ